MKLAVRQRLKSLCQSIDDYHQKELIDSRRGYRVYANLSQAISQYTINIKAEPGDVLAMQ